MVAVHESDYKQRRDFVDASAENLAEILEKARGGDNIDEERIDYQLGLLNDLLVLKPKHGVVTNITPKGRDDERIPVYPLMHDESVKLDLDTNNHFHPRQRESIQKFLAVHSIDRIVVDDIEQIIGNKQTWRLEPQANLGAAVFNRISLLTGEALDPRQLLRTSMHPILLLRQSDFRGTLFSRQSPDFLAHELVHVQQLLETPNNLLETAGDLEKMNVGLEVEAYSVQWDLVRELDRQEYAPNREISYRSSKYNRHMQILGRDSRLHNFYRNDKYYPSPYILEDLKTYEAKTGVVYTLPTEVDRSTPIKKYYDIED